MTAPIAEIDSFDPQLEECVDSSLRPTGWLGKRRPLRDGLFFLPWSVQDLFAAEESAGTYKAKGEDI